MPSELVARDSGERRVADGLADQRWREPEHHDTSGRDRSRGERSDRGTAGGSRASEPERNGAQPDDPSGDEGCADQNGAGKNEQPASSGQHRARADERVNEVAPENEEGREDPDLDAAYGSGREPSG